jgi:hypothetical protein
MGVTVKEFGSVLGNVNQDVRFVIGGSGRKSALAITCSYESAVLFGGGVVHPAFDTTTFYGRLLVIEGLVFPETEIDLDTVIEGRPYLDLAISSLGPHTFFFPIAQLEGNLQTSRGGTLAIVLARATTAVFGQTFRGRISVAGQTIQSGGA